MTTSDIEPTTVTDELAAIRKIANTLEGLDPAARTRILTWLDARYTYAGTAHDPAEAQAVRASLAAAARRSATAHETREARA